MKSLLIRVLTVAAAATAASPAANGHRIINIGDPAGEQEFQSTVQGLRFYGVETFSGSTLAADAQTNLGTHILSPGVSAAHFPGGTDTTLGITIQVNTLGGDPATLSPGGRLFASGPAVGDTGVVRVGPEDARHSLDIIVDPPAFRGQVRAVSFTAFQEGGGNAEVRLYGSDNRLLAIETASHSAPEDAAGYGFFAPEGETIFRINYRVPDGYGDVGSLNLYVIPEPATAAAIFGAAVLLLVFRRRFV